MKNREKYRDLIMKEYGLGETYCREVRNLMLKDYDVECNVLTCNQCTDLFGLWLDEEYDEFAEEKKKIMELAGEEFDIDSVEQLKVILFEKLKLPIPADNTGEDLEITSNQMLAQIVNEHEIVREIMRYQTLKMVKER